MIGREKTSWQNVLKEAGYEVEYQLKGLGEYEGIRKLFLEHIKDASFTHW